MKKMCKILFTIIVIFSLSNTIYAKELQFGELRYEITELNITDTKVKFTGWAFIGRTQNGRDENNKFTSPKVKITAYINGKEIESIIFEADKEHPIGNWNFFYENFYRSWKTDKINQVTPVYNGKGYSDSSGTWDNKCTEGNNYSQCYYENIGFKIEFDTSKWNITDKQDVKFEISAYNSDYAKKDTRNVSKGQKGWTNTESLSISSPVASINNKSKNISVYTENSNVLKAMAEDAMFRKTGSTNDLVDCDGSYCIIDPGEDYVIPGIKNNYIKSTSNAYPSGTYGSGMYAVGVDNISDACTGITGKKGCLHAGTEKNYYVYSSWMKKAGTFWLTIEGYKKCSPDNSKNEKLNCNENKSYENECNHLTIYSDKYKVENNEFYDFRVDIKFNQKITISSVLTPDRTYSGGGFKFNVIYNNDISWDYFGDGNISCTVINNDGTVISKECNNEKIKEIIEEKLNEKIYTIYDLESKINLTATEHKNNKINFIKKCYGNDKFSGKKMKAVCLFTLPKAEMDKYSGVIAKYNIDISNLDVNNKYFTGLNDIGDYIINPTISELNRFKDSAAKEDSKDKKSWLGNSSKDFENCKINLYPLLYTEKGNYRFIYRPIDLNNPFPNRNAGFNWYDWINNENNRERLKNSYSKLQYSINLNSQTINSIRDYNDSHNYLKWDFDGDESDFINKNSTLFNKVRENVGDNS